MQVTGLVRDLGKLLFFFGSQGQWDIVGNTFIKFPDFMYVTTFIYIITTIFLRAIKSFLN